MIKGDLPLGRHEQVGEIAGAGDSGDVYDTADTRHLLRSLGGRPAVGGCKASANDGRKWRTLTLTLRWGRA
jgi:hypothetical protein